MAKVAQGKIAEFTNSPLVSYTCISPNKTNGRTVPASYANRWDGEIIDTITIHCVVGQASVESLGNVFANPARQASSNYGIGYDGRVGMYVEEKDRSWCSGGEKNCNGMTGSLNDYRAVTIEVASDTEYPYAVTDAAYASIIELCADICKRNGIKKLLWEADPDLVWDKSRQNMTAHRWFAYKSCPGDYLYERFGDIAEKVNRKLDPNPGPQPTPEDRVKVKDHWDREYTVALQVMWDCRIVDGIISRQAKSDRASMPNVVATNDNGDLDGTFEYRGWPAYIGGSALVKEIQKWVGVSADGHWGENTTKAWQKAMNDNGYGPIGTDGIFGPKSARLMGEWINDWYRRHPNA